MIVLALETSAVAGSVAVLQGDHLLAEQLLDPSSRSAQTLAPALVAVLAAAGRTAAEVGLVAAAIGPGSFTGLRVGVTTAKTFAYAVGAEVIGVNSLDVIAAQTPLGHFTSETAVLHVVMDAQRKELFVGRYRTADGAIERCGPDTIMPIDSWLNSLQRGDVVTGTGLHRLESRLPADVGVVETGFREPKAATVGLLAWRDYQAGRRDDLWKLAPQYGRASAAEEKASQKT